MDRPVVSLLLLAFLLQSSSITAAAFLCTTTTNSDMDINNVQLDSSSNPDTYHQYLKDAEPISSSAAKGNGVPSVPVILMILAIIADVPRRIEDVDGRWEGFYGTMVMMVGWFLVIGYLGIPYRPSAFWYALWYLNKEYAPRIHDFLMRAWYTRSSCTTCPPTVVRAHTFLHRFLSTNTDGDDSD